MCGVVAARLGPAATVNLRNPPPLNRPLEVKRLGRGLVALLDGEKVIAEGTPAVAEIEIPTPVSVSEAEAAACRYPGLVKHPFPRCFGCGPQRAEGDGLRIFPGQVARQGVLAAPWIPSASIGDADGRVPPEFVWAAVDCPGGWALIVNAAPDAEEGMVTGQMAVTVNHPVECGAPYVVVAWPIGSEGRRLYAGTAIFSADGELCAGAKATWVVVSTGGAPRGLGAGEREP